MLESVLQQPQPAYPGWSAFRDVGFIANSLLMMCLAAGLGAAMTFRPRNHRTAKSLEDLETVHIYTIYAVVGAIVGIMVVQYGMVVGFVLFGIGGLIRFRTVLRSASRTGRVILVTLIGLSCGLRLPHVAVLATIFGYALISILDSRVTYRMQVKGIDPENFTETDEAYQKLLDELSCRVLSVRKNPGKHRLIYVFRCYPNVDDQYLENLFDTRIDPGLRATVEWEID